MNLSFGKKVLYALGQFGLVLGAFAVGNLFVSFFVTRSFVNFDIFPVFIYQGYIFGFFTVAGLIIAVCKLFDAASGLFFGFASDRNTMKRGRRIGFMLLSALPLSVFSVMIFFPPIKDGYLINSVWVLVCTVLFYFFLSLYTTPYLALMSELGKTQQERLYLSTFLACATALASLLGNRVFYFMETIRTAFGLTSIMSFRLVIIAYALVSFMCMLAPSLFLNEKKYCESVPVQESFGVSLRTVLNDAYFRPFFIADIMYRIAFSFIIASFSWYVTILLGLSIHTVAYFLSLIFFLNLLLFVPMCFVTQILGKRKALFIAVFLFILVLVASIFAGRYPFDPFIQGIILSVLVALPLSVFTVVPNALVSDLVIASERRTGVQRGGMYFGVHSLAIKIGQLFSALFFPSLMLIGSSAPDTAGHAGLQITLALAAFFSIIGFLFLLGYREKEVTVLL